MRTQYITSIGLFYKEVGFYLEGGLTCEELSGSYSQEMMGLDYCLTPSEEKMREIIGSR